MPEIGPGIPEYDYFPNEAPAIVGRLETGASVAIEVWRDGDPVSVESTACTEIGSTGRYSWSTGNFSSVPAGRTQYHWRMTGGGSTDQGDFVLVVHEDDGHMPSIKNRSNYVVKS